MNAAELGPSARYAGYRPEQPIPLGPLHKRPLQLGKVAKSLFGFPGIFLPWNAFFFGLAFIEWHYFLPDESRLKIFSADWIVTLALCNLVTLVTFATAQHVWLYGRKSQGTEYKYNSAWLATGNSTFMFGSQLWDNVFWNICSAVPFWTAYEVLTLWLQANGYVPTASWQEHPIYCTSLILVISVWIDLHFYLTHRLLHWQPLYKTVHYLHHKNANFGPWSGVAMHPVEHLIFFSSILLFWVLPANTLLTLYMLQIFGIAPSLAHVGFERLMFGKERSLSVDNYMHYLHHKHVNVNFGNSVEFLPFDKWMGTFHDGSDQAAEALKNRMLARAARKRASRARKSA